MIYIQYEAIKNGITYKMLKEVDEEGLARYRQHEAAGKISNLQLLSI